MMMDDWLLNDGYPALDCTFAARCTSVRGGGQCVHNIVLFSSSRIMLFECNVFWFVYLRFQTPSDQCNGARLVLQSDSSINSPRGLV